MLEINLLPVEYRPKEHTPYPRFILVVGGITLAMLELFLIGHYKLRKINPTREEITNQRNELTQNLQPKANKTTQLEAEKKSLEKRKDAVKDLEKDKVFFYTELAAVYNTLPKYAWISRRLDLQKTKRPGGRDEQLQLSMDMMTGAAQISIAEDFIKVLKEQNQEFSLFTTANGGTVDPPSANVQATPGAQKGQTDLPASVVIFKVNAYSGALKVTGGRP
jgi:hypothetical protein